MHINTQTKRQRLATMVSIPMYPAQRQALKDLAWNHNVTLAALMRDLCAPERAVRFLEQRAQLLEQTAGKK